MFTLHYEDLEHELNDKNYDIFAIIANKIDLHNSSIIKYKENINDSGFLKSRIVGWKLNCWKEQLEE